MVRSLTIALASAGVLVLFALPAESQQMAAAPNVVPTQRHLVFMEEGGRLPTSAASILQNAAAAAKTKPVTVEGRSMQAAEVKRELIRLGAPSESVIVRPSATSAVPAPSDGLPNPAQRHVVLDF